MKKHFLALVSMVTLLSVTLGLVTTLSGCSGYRHVTVTKEGIRFSFEYPITYQNQDRTNPLNERDFSIVFLRPEGETILLDYSNIVTIFSINIYNRTAKYLSAKSYLDECLIGYSASRDFQLFTRSTITVSRIEGEIVSYKLRSGLKGEYLNPKISFFKEVYFDYLNRIYVIGISYYQEITSQAEAEFNHIINSFKFID